MNVLENQAQRFVFFDLEKSALDNVALYAKQIGLNTSVEVRSEPPFTRLEDNHADK